MNNWKEFDINNLPSDILSGKYEAYNLAGGLNISFKITRHTLASMLKNGLEKYHYRKIEPKAPSHKEIMTKWWKSGVIWEKVHEYDQDDGEYYIQGRWVEKDWFIGKESADIPPEAENPND